MDILAVGFSIGLQPPIDIHIPISADFEHMLEPYMDYQLLIDSDDIAYYDEYIEFIDSYDKLEQD